MADGRETSGRENRKRREEIGQVVERQNKKNQRQESGAEAIVVGGKRERESE